MSLHELCSPDTPIHIVDIGANPIDGSPPYADLQKHTQTELIAFEPQADAIKELQASAQQNTSFLSYAIADGKEHRLHICQASGMTSLLEPDMEQLKYHHGFAQWANVTETQSIETTRLDDVDEITQIDYLKMDVQGSELMVLQHGQDKLNDALFLQLEVSFTPLYKNEALFGDIDHYLREQGWMFHCFAQINKRMIAPMMLNNSPHTALNHIQQADAVYIRPFTAIECVTSEQLKKIALISHYCYHSYDLALFALNILDTQEDSKTASAYAQLLMSKGEAA